MLHKGTLAIVTIVLLAVLKLEFFERSTAIGQSSGINEQVALALKTERIDPRPWWLGDFLTLLGILAGAMIIVYQLGRQHRNELEIQKENYREQLRLQIYEEFSRVLEEASDKSIKAGMYAFFIPTDLGIFRDQLRGGSIPAPIASRANEFSKKHSMAKNAIIRLIRLIEKYEVVGPELNIFKMAINVASHDADKAFTPLFSYLLQILPMDVVTPTGQSKVMNVVEPTEEMLSKLKALVNSYKNAEDDLMGYFYDMNVELQNVFLSKLFGRLVPRRKSLNPNVKVITTDLEEMERLRRYFEDETDWGRQKRQTEETVRAGLGNL